MRFLLYNIAYGTGAPAGRCHSILTLHRYLRSARHHFSRICEFVTDVGPDVTGLVEVDRGSFRCGSRDQVAEIARLLTHHHSYSSKYGHRSFGRFLPILRHQGNVVLTHRKPEHTTHHFFSVGFKRLVVEANIDGVFYFLVHLALRRRIREKQLQLLAHLVGNHGRPVILAGDFNTFGGREELGELLAATGLRNANPAHVPTFPSYGPRKELDFILCSDAIRVNDLTVHDEVKLSDHLPISLDFDVV